MTEGEKGWGIGTALIGLIIWAFKHIFGGEKRKTNTESNKLQVETENTSLDLKIKAAEYFEKKYAEALVKIDELRKMIDLLEAQAEQARKEAEDSKIQLTLEKIKANKR
jgi:hypothetical protein